MFVVAGFEKLLDVFQSFELGHVGFLFVVLFDGVGEDGVGQVDENDAVV